MMMIKEFRYDNEMDEVTNVKGPVVFLAGPTVRGNQPHLTSWRFECIEEFKRQGFEGSLVIPEFISKTASDKGVNWIPLWEFTGLRRADCILFWVPRTKELIGLTTNWELGYWMGREPEKVVYGRPDDAYRCGYLDIMWKATYEDIGFHVPTIHNTMKQTVESAIDWSMNVAEVRAFIKTFGND